MLDAGFSILDIRFLILDTHCLILFTFYLFTFYFLLEKTISLVFLQEEFGRQLHRAPQLWRMCEYFQVRR